MIKSGNKINKRVYTVVEVFQGVAETAYSFRHRKDAWQHLKKLEREKNLDEDDVQIFENNIVD